MADFIVRLFTSLRLTVVCLSLALVLVFVGTLAQVQEGLYAAQFRYFRSFFIWWGPANAEWKIPVFPGGYLLGGILIINLLASHLKRFGFARHKAGIILVHVGLILLLLGQLFTDLLAVESSMRLTEGQTKNYSESQRQSEIVVIDATDPDHDRVVSIPEHSLAAGKEVRHPGLPFTLRVERYYPNSTVANRSTADASDPPVATQGLGTKIKLASAPPTVRMDFRNIPSAVVEIVPPSGASLGTWLVSCWLDQPQRFEWNGRTYTLAMRFMRHYKPFSLTLLEFRHDKYRGTEIPKNFSSKVRLKREETGEDREVLIYMNNPLRYGGETFYQSGYDDKDPRVTILQVVRNPSWLTPYLACILVGAGLTLQFVMHLLGFMKRRST
jgi:hypothetical protein